MNQFQVILLIATISMLLTACGGGGGGGSTNSNPTVSGPVSNNASEDDAEYNISQSNLLANASDADGDTLSVSNLTVDSGDASGLTINSNNIDVSPNAYNTLVASDEIIEVTYTISDGNGGTVNTSVQITIAAVNDLPASDAGSDQSVDENNEVSLTGSGADPEGAALTYAWSQVSGPNVEFTATDTAATTFTAPLAPISDQAQVVLRLTVTDADGGASSDDIAVNINSTDVVIFLANKDSAGITELYKYDPEADDVSKLSGTMVSGGIVTSAEFSPDGAYVAYIADQDTNDVNELYVAAIDGSGITKVNAPMANALGDITNFQWSPDSQQLVYLADADLDDIKEVFLVDRDGANHQKINGIVGTPPSVQLDKPKWSPDGRYIAQEVVSLSDGRRHGINVYDSTVGAPNSTRITNLPSFAAILGDYTWSPDSTRVAYRADQSTNDVIELYTAFADDSDNPRISSSLVPGGNVTSFEWSPDGSRLAYLADQDTDTVNELYSIMADGSDLVEINDVLTGGGSVSSYRWSPDGSRIAFYADQDTDDVFELFTNLPDGSDIQKVSGMMVPDGDVISGSWGSFDWAPDSTRLLYVADQDTDTVNEVYAALADGTNNTKVSGPEITATFFTHINSVEEQLSSWAPNSTDLFFVTNAPSGGSTFDIYGGDINGDTHPQLTRTPVASGSLVWFGQWSADSSRIVYVSRQEDPGKAELFMATPDGVENQKVSGPMIDGGFVSHQSVRWSPQ